MLIDGTILGVARIRTSLLLVGAFLTLLFTFVEPESSRGLTFFPRLVFWILQVAAALTGIVLASYLIRLFSRRKFPVFVAVGITGVIGATISTPAFCLIDQFFPGLLEEPDDWLDAFALRGWWQAQISELLDILPTFLASWYAVNIPLFFKTTLLNHPPEPDDPDENEEDDLRRKHQASVDEFFANLPEALGSDVVAISSDLHYLNVHTTLGKTLILGSLSHYAEAFDEAGLLVHRSHWVAKDHVERVFVSSSEAYCLMSNGLRVPISRSKRKLVKDYFGQTTLAKQDSTVTQIRKMK